VEEEEEEEEEEALSTGGEAAGAATAAEAACAELTLRIAKRGCCCKEGAEGALAPVRKGSTSCDWG